MVTSMRKTGFKKQASEKGDEENCTAEGYFFFHRCLLWGNDFLAICRKLGDFDCRLLRSKIEGISSGLEICGENK